MTQAVGTFKSEDVTILLKDITGLVEPIPTKEREKLIQSGVHYSQMLPLEYEPSKEYLEAYENALESYSKLTANAVAAVSEKIFDKKGRCVVLVSLARAGTPIGVLIKRYMIKRYSISPEHYTISIIRGKGIDKNAMRYILNRHRAEDIQFVDGWTGKGAIQNQLKEAMKDYCGVDDRVAVLSDPAFVAGICGTHDDFLIPSSCLNSTVSGLLSRTFLRDDLIGDDDFHGVAFYKNLKDKDKTYEFINAIEAKFPEKAVFEDKKVFNRGGIDEVKKICKEFGISDINLVKPSIGETTRVLLRRVPWKILVRSLDDNEHLAHIYRLALEKNVDVIEYPLENYRACGIIRNIADV